MGDAVAKAKISTWLRHWGKQKGKVKYRRKDTKKKKKRCRNAEDRKAVQRLFFINGWRGRDNLHVIGIE